MREFLISMIDAILEYMLLGGDVAFTKNIIKSIGNAMIADSSKYGLFGAGTAGEAISAALRGYAIAILIVWFLQDIFDQLNLRGASIEVFARSLAKLLLSYLGLQFMYGALVNSVGVGMYLADGFSAAAFPELNIDQGLTLIHKYLKGMNILAIKRFVEIAIAFLIPYLILWITRILIFGSVILCAFKLAVCILYSPFALGNFFGDRDRSAGWMFIRRFVGLALQGLAIMVIIWSGSVMLNSMLTTDKDTAQIVNDMHDPSQKIDDYKLKVSDSVQVVSRIALAYGTPLTAPISIMKSAAALVSGSGKTASQTIIDDVIQKGAGAELLNEIISGNSLINLCVIQCAVAALIRRLDQFMAGVITF